MTTLDTRPFADDGKTAVHGLRRALAEVLVSVGANADQPQEISRQFGLDKTLAWRISRVVREEDVWEAVQHIPRRPSIRLFVNAMTKHGASPDRVESVWRALGEFERFVEVHSGDRETLEMMVSAGAKRTSGKRMEAFRKMGFQANSAIWGVQARVQVSLHLMAPSKVDPSTLSMSTIAGLSDFRRLRADVPWAVAAMSQWDRQAGPIPLWRPNAMDPDLGEGEPPLLKRFCSDPLPEMESFHERSNLVRFMLKAGPVGNTAAATVIFGWNYPSVASQYQSYPGEEGEHGVMLTTPAELLVHDLFIHRSLAFAFNPTAQIYSQLPGGPIFPAATTKSGILPVPDDATDLGTGPPDTTTPEMPRYREMVEFATNHAGYELNEFQGYRLRVRYPPIPTLATLRHRLRAR